MDLLIKLRHDCFKLIRNFFDQSGYIEVDPPIVSRSADINEFIEPIQTDENNFLHTSPEYAMKMLLFDIKKNIYFLGHVFRKEETGRLHNIEFSMVEWYKINTTEEEFLNEISEFLYLFIGKQNIEKITYKDALKKYAKSPDIDTSSFNEDEIRHYVWAHFVEPNLGNDKITIVCDFPKEDSVFAKIENNVAKRYEFYFQSIELANGFYELSTVEEHYEKMKETNKKRLDLNKKPFSINKFFKQKNKSLPKNTYGVAAGLDRLIMLKQNEKEINKIIPHQWHF